MDSKKVKPILFKLFAFWILFLIFHFLYDWLPNPVTAVFAGTSEGAVQHMKMALWAYAFTSLGEFFILHPDNLKDRLRFLDSRLVAADMAPWAMFFWYLLPIFVGKPLSSEFLEILYANIVLLIVGAALILLERDFAQIKLSKVGRIVALVWFILSAFLLAAVSFVTPWAGFFVA